MDLFLSKNGKTASVQEFAESYFTSESSRNYLLLQLVYVSCKEEIHLKVLLKTFDVQCLAVENELKL